MSGSGKGQLDSGLGWINKSLGCEITWDGAV